MTTTFIKTGNCKHVKHQGAGEVAEIMNPELCGAENVLGMLRWLAAGESLDAACTADQNQLLYVMDGKGVITLEKKDYNVAKGAGIYLGPSERASIRQAGSTPLKLFHLQVPKVKQ
jgi:mannose-6-phosphate isomerase-like protein (cupin superfamily)